MLDDDNNQIGDIDNEINNMITEEKTEKKKQKIIIITIISFLIVLAVLIPITILTITIIKNKNNNNKDDYSTEPLIIEPVETYSYCLIFLHGLNDSATHFQQYFEKINFEKKKNTKFIFLRAPKTDIKYKNKKNITSWFNIYSLPIKSSRNYSFEDATKSRDVLVNYIEKEVKLLNNNYEKIFIGGHSQGACISLYTGYTFQHLLGGVISLCGFLFPQVNIVGNKDKLKVFLIHGKRDKIFPFDFHNQTIDKIIGFSGVETYYQDNLTHFFDQFPELIDVIKNFLNYALK